MSHDDILLLVPLLWVVCEVVRLGPALGGLGFVAAVFGSV